MKIITLKRLTENKEPLVDEDYTQCDPNDWFCVIETKEEELFYDKYVCGNKGLAGETNAEHIWNDMVKHAGQGMGVSWGDDDMYGYFRPDEAEPEVGEEWVDWDGDKWRRME